jgi:hypothetical protein
MRRAAIFLALLALACEDEPEPAREKLSGTLDVDIRDKAELSLSARGEALEVELTLTSGFGVAPSGTRLAGRGHVERFPEAEATLYTARFSLAPETRGPCGAEPVSLALALHARDGNPTYAGSLTAYCGPETWFGKPARPPLRLFGSLR